MPAPAPPQSFSYTRWGKTVTTFGPAGRLAWTAVVLLVVAAAVFSGDVFAIGPICLIAAPLVLRSVWARGRVV